MATNVSMAIPLSLQTLVLRQDFVDRIVRLSHGISEMAQHFLEQQL